MIEPADQKIVDIRVYNLKTNNLKYDKSPVLTKNSYRKSAVNAYNRKNIIMNS